ADVALLAPESSSRFDVDVLECVGEVEDPVTEDRVTKADGATRAGAGEVCEEELEVEQRDTEAPVGIEEVGLEELDVEQLPERRECGLGCERLPTTQEVLLADLDGGDEALDRAEACAHLEGASGSLGDLD